MSTSISLYPYTVSAEGSVRQPLLHISHKAWGKVRGKEDVANHLSTQRAAATRPLRAEVKLVTGAQLSEAGSYASAVLRRSLVVNPPKT